MKRQGNFFIWIVLLAAGLMITIAVAQVITQKSLTTLRLGNEQAATTFTMNNRLQEMVNLAFELEAKMLNGKSADLISPQRGIKDSLTRLEYNIVVLRKLWADTAKASSLNRLVLFVERQVNLSFGTLNALEKKNPALGKLRLDSLRNAHSGDSIFFAAADLRKNMEQVLLDSIRKGHLGDSIYSSAVSFQKGLEQNLGATLERNNNVASKLSLLNRLLAGVALLAVLVLATIIIRRQVKQLSLIKDLEEARKVALQSAEAKDQFLANMSHEIRTPLNAIKGFGRILAQTPLNNDQQKYASIISTASENLLNIVNDILDFSKIEAGNLVMKKKTFHLYQVVSEVQMMFTPLAQEKELEMAFSVDESIPLYVKGDPERLRQILVNLLSNAIKFTNAGKVTIRVEQADEKNSAVKIRFLVTDTGVGIPPEKISLVFERFEQLDYSFTRQQGGTGLGLAITRKLVEAMGGTINVTSEVNKGSAFTVEIEFEKVNDTAVEKEMLIPAGEKNQLSLKKMKLLVAEDNKMNQLLVKSILDKYEIDTDITENGNEAIAALEKNAYSLVLMDVQMPVMDGISATKLYRKRFGNSIPIIAMTAHVLPGEREKCIEAGMNDYLTKPLDEEELVIILKRYLVVQSTSENSAAANTDSSIFNLSYLNNICRNDQTKVRQILMECRKMLPSEKEALQKKLEENDPAGISKICHHLKSTLSPLSAFAGAVICLNKLSHAVKETSSGKLYLDLGYQLIDELDNVMAQLDTYLLVQ